MDHWQRTSKMLAGRHSKEGRIAGEIEEYRGKRRCAWVGTLAVEFWENSGGLVASE